MQSQPTYTYIMPKWFKIFLCVVAAIAIAIGSYMVYREATKEERFTKYLMNSFLEDLQAYRNGDTILTPEFATYEFDNPVYYAFVLEQIRTLAEERDYALVAMTLHRLERHRNFYPEIRDVITDVYTNSYTLLEKLALLDESRYVDFEYYNEGLVLYKDDFASYISEHGENQIFYEEGQGGYYDNIEETSTHTTIGLPNSPLGSSKSSTHYGDFRVVLSSSVSLNQYYEETHSTSLSYSFRGNYLSFDFDPRDKDCVYSGDYLFCFDDKGQLLDYARIKEQ